MKHPVSTRPVFSKWATLVLGLCAALSTSAFADPVQATDPPGTKPPSSLPPGQPSTDRSTEHTHTNTDAIGASSGSAELAKKDPSTREMEKVRNLAKTSESFVKAAAQDGMLEVELGKVATSKASNQQIKDFGKHLAADHDKANMELKKAAKASNVQVPGGLDAEHRAKLEELQSKSGAAFDAAYAAEMAKDHEKALTLFREASTSPGVDSNLQAFAKKTLPTLEEHNSTAKQLHNGISAMTSSGSQPKVSSDSN